ncbi:MAG: hypothetical protein ACK5UG_02840 [Synechococcaceae cyanobacterium]
MLAGVLLASPAGAGPVVLPDGSLEFLYSINGGEDPLGNNPDPLGPKPWLKALISEVKLGSRGNETSAVDITLTTSLGPGGFAKEWAFNLKPELLNEFTRDQFTFECTSTGNDVCSGMTDSSYVWDPNNVRVPNGWSGFDLAFLLPTAKAKRLSDGTTLTLRMMRKGGITPAAFNFPVTGDPLGEYTAVHVGGIGEGSRYSTTLLDDPPASAPMPLPVLGALAAFSASRRLRRRLAAAP